MGLVTATHTYTDTFTLRSSCTIGEWFTIQEELRALGDCDVVERDGSGVKLMWRVEATDLWALRGVVQEAMEILQGYGIFVNILEDNLGTSERID